MTALARFWKRGAADADRRVAAILSPATLGNADRYLMSSALVGVVDHVLARVHMTMLHSQSAHVAATARQSWRRAGWAERYRTLGLALIIAVAVHVGATLISGQRPVWFRVIVPAVIAAFAAVALIASRAAADRN